MCRKDGGMGACGGECKERECIDGRSEWTGAFVDGQNVRRVERSLDK